jgi:hypothetical protein
MPHFFINLTIMEYLKQQLLAPDKRKVNTLNGRFLFRKVKSKISKAVPLYAMETHEGQEI